MIKKVEDKTVEILEKGNDKESGRQNDWDTWEEIIYIKKVGRAIKIHKKWKNLLLGNR